MKHGNYKLQLRIARIVMETELQNKHQEKRVSWKKKLKTLEYNLKIHFGLILYNALIHQINKAIESRSIAILSRHKKKLEKFRERQHKPKRQIEEKLKR